MEESDEGGCGGRDDRGEESSARKAIIDADERGEDEEGRKYT